jgi:mRNA interferase MazF
MACSRRLIMSIKQFEIWIADLNPQIGTEPGKTRPVLAIQTNLLNKIPHPSTIVCPITTNVKKDSEILRVHLKKGTANLHQACDIMIDQIRAIDNKRLTKRLGVLPDELIDLVKENIQIVLDLE